MLGDKRFFHAVGDWAVVKALEGLFSHAHLISDSKEQVTSFGTVNGDLADYLVEALTEQLFADWTDTTVTGLLRVQVLIKAFNKVDNIMCGGGRWRHVADPKLALFDDFLRWQNAV